MPSSTDQPNELDALLHLESTFHAEGLERAEEHGAAVGLEEGRAMGWKSGVALTSELEFFHGAAAAILALSETFGTLIPAKAVASAHRLQAACRQVSLAHVGNDRELDMDAHAGKLRVLFRQTVAFAGMAGVRFEGSNRSRLADFSF